MYVAADRDSQGSYPTKEITAGGRDGEGACISPCRGPSLSHGARSSNREFTEGGGEYRDYYCEHLGYNSTPTRRNARTFSVSSKYLPGGGDSTSLSKHPKQQPFPSAGLGRLSA